MIENFMDKQQHRNFMVLEPVWQETLRDFFKCQNEIHKYNFYNIMIINPSSQESQNQRSKSAIKRYRVAR